MYFLYVAKELTRRKGRTATNLLAVTAVIAILIIVTSVMDAYATAIYLPFKDVSADMVIQKLSSQTAHMPDGSAIRLPFGKGVFSQNEIDSISAMDHVEDVSRALVLWNFDKDGFISIEGLEPDNFVGNRLSSRVTAGRFIATGDENTAVAEKHFAKFLGLEVGDGLVLGNTTFEVIGILATRQDSQIASSNIYVNLGDAQRLIGTEGYSQVYLTLDTLSSEDVVRSKINRVDEDALVVSGSSIATSLSNVMRIYRRFYLLGLVVITLIVALILFQVNATGLMERRRDIGVMQAVGWTRKNITVQVVSEVFLQTTLGFALGVIISAIAVIAIGSISVRANLSASLAGDVSTLAAPLSITGIALIQFFALAVAISGVVSFLLTRRISGMKPLMNLRDV